jgi:2-polyprenyl-3-methyl-5-hydroxy-6-metoxy-1,4-benzoquinol methylase
MNKTELIFWETYWESLKLPSIVNKNFSFDRCLSRELIKIIKQFPEKGEVLEIGCAPGKYLELFHRYNFLISGIEYSQLGIEATKKNFNLLDIDKYNLICGDFFEIIPEPKFDFVISFGFIEHFDNPENVIQKHLDWLKPGGILIIGVPNFTGIHGILQKWLKKEILDVHNLNIMNTKYFKKIAKQLNITPIKIANICSFEPSLPISDKGVNFQNLIPKMILKLGELLRRFTITDKINASFLSAYIFASYRK